MTLPTEAAVAKLRTPPWMVTNKDDDPSPNRSSDSLTAPPDWPHFKDVHHAPVATWPWP
jgi:hypothetical protein